MPSAFPHLPAETTRPEPGFGGRPPVDHRPTGGGGGGGDDGQNDPWYGPRKLLHEVRQVVFPLLAADLFLFAVLGLYFFALFPPPPTASSTPAPGFPFPAIHYLNALLLLCSGLAVERARRNIFREADVLEEWLGLGHPALQRARFWLGGALGLGLLFAIGQWRAWLAVSALRSSFPARYDVSPIALFQTAMGLHGLHLGFGLLLLLYCLVWVHRLPRVELRQIVLDSVAWYWQLLVLAWLALIGVLALWR